MSYLQVTTYTTWDIVIQQACNDEGLLQRKSGVGYSFSAYLFELQICSYIIFYKMF